MCKESNYNDLQKENRFRNSQTDESVIDDLISDDPDKSNKVRLDSVFRKSQKLRKTKTPWKQMLNVKLKKTLNKKKIVVFNVKRDRKIF